MLIITGSHDLRKFHMRCQCDAMRCDAMRCDAMRCDAIRCVAMRWPWTHLSSNILVILTICLSIINATQRDAMRCGAVRCGAMRCDAMRWDEMNFLINGNNVCKYHHGPSIHPLFIRKTSNRETDRQIQRQTHRQTHRHTQRVFIESQLGCKAISYTIIPFELKSSVNYLNLPWISCFPLCNWKLAHAAISRGIVFISV